MDKKRLNLLEKAYAAEIDADLHKRGVHLIQTRSKLAETMVQEGLLAKQSIKIEGRFPVTIDGFELTHAGRMTYCMTCHAGVAEV